MEYQRKTTHVLQLVVQDVGADVRHHPPARGVLWALGGVELVEVAEANVMALADGVEVLHVAIRQKSFELVAAKKKKIRGGGRKRQDLRMPCHSEKKKRGRFFAYDSRRNAWDRC